MSIDATALPSELLVPPQPLIGFCGLDVYQNIVHKSIWDAFSTNRKADRAAVQFKLLPPTYDFPVAKPKRPSYEWYQPKGILKRNWMLKHLHVLPAVVVLFHDLEWNDSQWSEKQVQIVSTLQSLRNALHERNTRLCLVLLQKMSPLPPGEDALASERAVSLSAACGLNSKLLYILPHTEHLMGYTLRLESAFLDLAQTYYAQMAKRIRTHRDQLTTAHTTLKIRHQFKLGFVAEMRQDYSTGLKHYTQAYAILDEIRSTDLNYLEIKTIGGFLNYKICRLMFKLKVPRDAINHFISHIEKYKNRVGFKDLIFEHYGWLSTQHSHFAELFCDAIKNGLPALQTQHPGIYYHKAAEYIVKRREAFQQNCALSGSESTSSTGSQGNNTTALYTEFFGIRAGKAGEPIAEQQINMVVRDSEKSFNHSSAIINLLSQAMAQFKLYKCLRFRKKLAIDMADEYFKTGDHAKALTLYSLMLPDFRQDNWFYLFSDVLLKTLRCAVFSASVLDFVACSLEALSLKIRADQKDRIIILENLWKVLTCTPPLPQHQFAPEVRDLWETNLAAVKSPLQIDLDKIYEIIEMYATFEQAKLKNDDQVRIHVILRLQTDVPIKLRNFALLLTDGSNIFKLQAIKYATFNTLNELANSINTNKNANEIELNTTTTTIANKSMPITMINYQNLENDLKLQPELYYQLIFNVQAEQFSENTQLRVARIEANMGTEKLSTLLIKHASYTRKPFRHFNRQCDLNDNITIHPICYIAPTFHLVTQTNFTHESMLVNEYFPIVTTVSNLHNVFLQNIGINVTVPATLRNKAMATLKDYLRITLTLLFTAQWKYYVLVESQAVPSIRIVGGTTITIASAPFMVSLRVNGIFLCGGTLIGSMHVVTAAHCVQGLRPSNLLVTGGATFLNELGIRRNVQKIFTPRGYRAQTMNADVAVLKLTDEMKGPHTEPIGLCNADWSVGGLVQVFGWGQTKETNPNSSNQLRSVIVPLIARAQCMRQYRAVARITSTMFCASAPGAGDACDGDSGGPLIYKNRLCGIVSWGIGCARRNYPGVYTNVRVVEKFIKDAIVK